MSKDKQPQLYRISYIYDRLKNGDVDGVSIEIVNKVLERLVYNGYKMSYLKVKPLSEEELKQPSHKSHRDWGETIGDVFRNPLYQEMMSYIYLSK